MINIVINLYKQIIIIKLKIFKNNQKNYYKQKIMKIYVKYLIFIIENKIILFNNKIVLLLNKNIMNKHQKKLLKIN